MRHLFFLLFIFGLSAAPVGATELVYTPINPSFGGNSFNGTYLLGAAESQNDHQEKYESYNQDPLDNFEESLSRRLMSVLATKIVDSAFGEYDADLGTGSYEFGDYTIDIVANEGESIHVVITDTFTGGTTEVEVPYYQ